MLGVGRIENAQRTARIEFSDCFGYRSAVLMDIPLFSAEVLVTNRTGVDSERGLKTTL